MEIPALNTEGFLPEGIYPCSLREAQARFGVFQGSDRRPQLWAKLRDFLHEIVACGVIEAVLLARKFHKPSRNSAWNRFAGLDLPSWSRWRSWGFGADSVLSG